MEVCGEQQQLEALFGSTLPYVSSDDDSNGSGQRQLALLGLVACVKSVTDDADRVLKKTTVKRLCITTENSRAPPGGDRANDRSEMPHDSTESHSGETDAKVSLSPIEQADFVDGRSETPEGLVQSITEETDSVKTNQISLSPVGHVNSPTSPSETSDDSMPSISAETDARVSLSPIGHFDFPQANSIHSQEPECALESINLVTETGINHVDPSYNTQEKDEPTSVECNVHNADCGLNLTTSSSLRNVSSPANQYQFLLEDCLREILMLDTVDPSQAADQPVVSSAVKKRKLSESSARNSVSRSSSEPLFCPATMLIPTKTKPVKTKRFKRLKSSRAGISPSRMRTTASVANLSTSEDDFGNCFSAAAGKDILPAEDNAKFPKAEPPAKKKRAKRQLGKNGIGDQYANYLVTFKSSSMNAKRSESSSPPPPSAKARMSKSVGHTARGSKKSEKSSSSESGVGSKRNNSSSGSWSDKVSSGGSGRLTGKPDGCSEKANRKWLDKICDPMLAGPSGSFGPAVAMSAPSKTQRIKICISGSQLLVDNTRKCFAGMRNFSIVNKWNEDVTHLVVKNHDPNTGLTMRSPKFLAALLSGHWILTVDWLRACVVAKAIVPEADYEIRGTVEMGKNDGPRRARLSISRKESTLFDEVRICCYGKFDGVDRYSKFQDDLEMLISLSGAKLQYRFPQAVHIRKTKPNDLFHAPTGSDVRLMTHLVIAEKSTSLPKKQSAAQIDEGILYQAVTPEWFLNCVEQYRILPIDEKFKLTS